MDKSITHDFLMVMNKFRRLTGRNHYYHKGIMVHNGELMMLGAIYNCLKEQKENHIKEPGVKVSELSRLLRSTKPATSKMLNTLEGKGFIERIADNQDRRVVYIRLSAYGEQKIEEALDHMYDFTRHTINRLGEEDARELVRLLDKFCDAIYDEIEERKKMYCQKDKNQAGSVPKDETNQMLSKRQK
ncbi:MAG: MarR family transcriptional regulator [Lachnoclostridium sp.]|jgi:DNA-binding MarR family transcriptional regulator